MAILSADLKQRVYSGKQLGYIDVTAEGNPTEDEMDELAPGEAVGESRLAPVPEVPAALSTQIVPLSRLSITNPNPPTALRG